MQRGSIHEARMSVRQNETDKTPTRPLSPPAPFWRRVGWSTLIPITALLLQLAGFLWLLVLTVSYVQDWGFIATLPHAAFMPVYVFLVAYGALRWEKGDKRTLYRCTAANALLLAIY